MPDSPDSSSNLKPWIDPDLEARIVALVLGEASDFEGEQLERIIGERRELQIFRNFIATAHRQLAEIGAAQPEIENDDEWRLSPDKRATVLAALGQPSPEISPETIVATPAAAGPAVAQAPIRRYRFWRVTSWAAAACLVVGLSWFGLMQLQFGGGYEYGGAGDGEEMMVDEKMFLADGADREFYKFEGEGRPAYKSDAPQTTSEPASAPAPPAASAPTAPSAPPPPVVASASAAPDRFRGDANFDAPQLGQVAGNSPVPNVADPVAAGGFSGGAAGGGAAPGDTFGTNGRVAMRDAEQGAAAAGPASGGDLGFDDAPVAAMDIGGVASDDTSIALGLREQSYERARGLQTESKDNLALGEDNRRGGRRFAEPLQPQPQSELPPAPAEPGGGPAPNDLGRKTAELAAVENPKARTARSASEKEAAQVGGEVDRLQSLNKQVQEVQKVQEMAKLEERLVEAEEEVSEMTSKLEQVNESLEFALGDKALVDEVADEDGAVALRGKGRDLVEDYAQFATPEIANSFGIIAPERDEEARKRVEFPEILAKEEPFSTFSLHVSDVSFKLAQASLANGQWPEASKIRIEEFVNAFDYGDPMPSTAEKIASQLEQTSHPFLTGRNLMRVSMRTAAAGRSSQTPLRLTILLDRSGSMEREDRRETTLRAFILLAQQLLPQDQVTLIGFAREPRLLADRVNGADAIALANILSQQSTTGGTNLEAALKMAYSKALEQKTEGAQNRIVLITDGAANLGDADPDRLAKIVESMRMNGIAFDAAGVGAAGLNDKILETLTRDGDGRYYFLDKPSDADAGFAKQIAGALRPAAMNVKIQIEFNPDRVGRYKLLGFEEHRLEKEDFRDDSVDAAELAAEEAGVAVYQFEPLPGGWGDVGTVSVRFRDMSSGQMVERRWPIPYEPSPSTIGNAEPPVRIASVAALVAAKLKGDPMGEVADFRELAQILNQMPERFRNQTRVQQLLTMIEQARQMQP